MKHFIILFISIFCFSYANAADIFMSQPEWLKSLVAEQKGNKHPSKILEVSYHEDTAYEIIRTDSSDMQDQEKLLNEKGELICTYGGYAGHVTSGDCKFEDIKLGRQLFPEK